MRHSVVDIQLGGMYFWRCIVGLEFESTFSPWAFTYACPRRRPTFCFIRMATGKRALAFALSGVFGSLGYSCSFLSFLMSLHLQRIWHIFLGRRVLILGCYYFPDIRDSRLRCGDSSIVCNRQRQTLVEPESTRHIRQLSEESLF
jgi:hypothetical protein